MSSTAHLFLFEAIQDGLSAIHDRDTAFLSGPTPEILGAGALESAFPVTDLAVASIGSAAAALAAHAGQAAGTAPGVRVSRRLASLWFDRSLCPIGWRVPSVRDAMTGDYRGADGWIRLHANAPHHRERALSLLGARGDREEVARRVAKHEVRELEEALVAAGACAAAMRTREEWAAHPQGSAVAASPLLVARRGREGRGAAAGQACPDRPLAGLRVLDLTRVLAGPVSTRFLAGYGAQVLRIDPPTWTEPGVVPEVTLGKFCAGLDLTTRADRDEFTRLLAQADVLVHGYRPGALAGLGFDDDERQRIRPGLVDVSLDAYGWSGPWSGRRGFDSLVQMSCGIAEAGMRWRSADKPVPLPVQALDHASGYIMAAAVLHGLIRRCQDGAGSIVKLALAGTAHLLMSAPAQAGRAFLPVEDADFNVVEERTAWGPARRLAPPCDVAGIPMRWERAAGPLRAEPTRNFF